ncbi:plasmid maintenance system killer protein [Agrobacterium tumefaciens]|nr:plasmid maintenance system killer protein [Agrobacterium tumefaciens]MBP2541033.1 plasmid maintenance system killer protein [Agrobacterium tumefaciens]MDP9873771.1 plasmid maintenance system killer protein [Agrobacterium tumefaciens]MDP9979182.1 plasmid maintenance system killer protein [Agrobacterium tumefaciens]
MIRSFKNKLTASIDDGSVKKGFPADLVRRAQQLLTILDAAIMRANIRSGSTSSGASASSGRKQGRKAWK